MATHEFDAFVSFSHLDDKSPNGRGWVTVFYSALDMWLDSPLGTNLKNLAGPSPVDRRVRDR